MEDNSLKTMKTKITIEVKGDKRKGKCWSKTVDSIDYTKKGGYMFIGDFLHDGEILLEVGTVILQIETHGSWKYSKQLAFIGIVDDDGTIDWIENEGIDWRKKSLTVAEKCSEFIVNKAAVKAIDIKLN